MTLDVLQIVDHLLQIRSQFSDTIGHISNLFFIHVFKVRRPLIVGIWSEYNICDKTKQSKMTMEIPLQHLVY